MGYTTYFDGEININPPLNPEQVKYINQFSLTRRMKRDPEKTALRPDPIREAVGLPLGVEAEYFVGESGFAGQGRGDDILERNVPPRTQPGLWCQWEVSEDGKTLNWDEGEKFYCYEEWLVYLILNFFAPWGRTLNGTIRFSGEDEDDRGAIFVKDNHVALEMDTIIPAKSPWEV